MFESRDEVVAWEEAHGGERGLRQALDDGRFGNDPRTVELVRARLEEHEAARTAEREAREWESRQREPTGAETAAIAAIQAADAASHSARWAFLAFVAATVAAAVSIAAYFWPRH